MPLTQLIYTSTVNEEVTEEALAEILQASLHHNGRHGITGMLLYCRGSFLQVLEGKEAAVAETFGRIARDGRHRNLVVIEGAPILRRSFGDWTMGYRRWGGRGDAPPPGYSGLLDSGFRTSELVQDPNFAKEILQKFARGN